MSFNLQLAIDAAFKAADDEIASLKSQIVDLEHQGELLLAAVDKAEKREVELNEDIIALELDIALLKTRVAELEAGGGNNPAPQPEPEPEPAPPATKPKWPKTTDTGPKGNLTNRVGGLLVNRDGDVIENLNITDTITVNANNVTIRNCRIKTAAWYGIIQNDGSSNLTVENCEIDGRGSSGMTGIAIQSGSTIRGCNIFGMVIAIKVWGSNCTIEGNYIHDLAEKSTNPDARHFDGIAMLAGSNLTVRNNAIIMPAQNGGTAATFIASQQGAVSNVKVLDNLLTGQASYTAYAAKEGYAMSGVVYDGNYIEKGIYGYILNSSGAQDTNNVKWDDAKDAVPEPVKAWRAAA